MIHPREASLGEVTFLVMILVNGDFHPLGEVMNSDYHMFKLSKGCWQSIDYVNSQFGKWPEG